MSTDRKLTVSELASVEEGGVDSIGLEATAVESISAKLDPLGG